MFQIRHNALGILQGPTMSGLLWFNTSGRPELGFMSFPSKEAADQYVKQTVLARPLDDSDKLAGKDVTIEPFDAAMHEKLLSAPGALKRKEARGKAMQEQIKAYPLPASITMTIDKEATGFIAKYAAIEGIGLTPEEAVEDLLKTMTKPKGK